MPMMVITTSNSTSVKPRCRGNFAQIHLFVSFEGQKDWLQKMTQGWKGGEAPFAGAALRVLRTKGVSPLFPWQNSRADERVFSRPRMERREL